MIPPDAIDRAVEAQHQSRILLSSGGDSALMADMISSTALRALLEAQPRVWTAETIKDAPEGRYMMRRRVHVESPESWNRYDLFDLDVAKAALSKTLELPSYDLAFGPIPTPPTGNEAGKEG